MFSGFKSSSFSSSSFKRIFKGFSSLLSSRGNINGNKLFDKSKKSTMARYTFKGKEGYSFIN